MQNNWSRRNFLKTAGTGSIVLGSAMAAPNALQAQASPSKGKTGAESAWFLEEDGAWKKSLSRPEHDLVFEFDVKVPLRDGVELSANIWRPKALAKYPVVLMYTPYDSTSRWVVGEAQYYASRGYAFAGIDIRGRYGSGGDSYLYWHRDWQHGGFEGQDVQDVLTWLGERPWSTGQVAMQGPSYLAMVQWMGAYLGSPYLKAMVPECSPGDHYNNVFPGGAFQLGNSVLFLTKLGGSRTNNDDLRSFFEWAKVYRHLPLRTMDQTFVGKKVRLWQDFLDHPDHDEYWRFSVANWPSVGELTPGKYSKVKAPTLNITGWYDQVQQDTINNYMEMVLYGPEELRDKHRLIIGPWRHATYVRKTGDIDFGPEADVDLKPIKLRWYDFWLKGIQNGIMDEPPVDVFVMGENKWRSEMRWPVSRAVATKYHFHSSGKANSRFGDGQLSITEPSTETADTFVYDPDDPVPTYGNVEPWQDYLANDVDGPRDRRAIQRRDDILVYTTSELDRDVEVTGRILVRLFAASSARDTDFAAILNDVGPDGYARILADGIIRARYRNSFKKQEFLTPGKVYEYTIDLMSVSHVFKKKHRIQIEISSSNFPNYDRNPNTGRPLGEDAEIRKAKQTVYHDHVYPSHIILPLVPA
ncbi:MAG TPA: CocE/NonD family hydrolase [Candidatus Dormibacteraeota bacterium]|nr:CocE/NonD family hydrolase [Candidatus Dormibacteraeota bacterium]